jgi:hypothetical protein
VQRRKQSHHAVHPVPLQTPENAHALRQQQSA